MERLTSRTGALDAVPTSFNLDFVFDMPDRDYKGLCDVLNRLAAYEDTTLTPENVELLKNTAAGKAIAEITDFDGVSVNRLRELAQAEKTGRVLVLPCKIGDTLWMVTQRRSKMSEPFYAFVKQTTLTYYNAQRCIANFGNSVFLTREEAYGALQKWKEANHET